MLDNFEKADTVAFLWEGTNRTKAQAAIAGILANPAFTTVLPTAVSRDEVVEFAEASDQPLDHNEKSRLDELWSRNFDHSDRYEMPLKSSA
jgi:aryl-alcohol dehydrogenase-like predicted oxidoreductase